MTCTEHAHCTTDHERKAAKRFLRQGKAQFAYAREIVKHPHPTRATFEAAALLRQEFYAQKIVAGERS